MDVVEVLEPLYILLAHPVSGSAARAGSQNLGSWRFI